MLGVSLNEFVVKIVLCTAEQGVLILKKIYVCIYMCVCVCVCVCVCINIQIKKAKWIGHILRRNCLLKPVIDEKVERRIDRRVT